MSAPAPNRSPRVLLAAVGNTLRGDDGFGPAVIAELQRSGSLQPWVDVVDAGIGGMALVHALMNGYDALIIADAVQRGAEPGAMRVLEPRVPDPTQLPAEARREIATNLHDMVPERVLLLARAMGSLPPFVRIVGCEPLETEEYCTELSDPVKRSVDGAVRAIREVLAEIERSHR